MSLPGCKTARCHLGSHIDMTAMLQCEMCQLPHSRLSNPPGSITKPGTAKVDCYGDPMYTGDIVLHVSAVCAIVQGQQAQKC